MSCTSHQIEKKQINVVFRLDDYSACSNTDLELRIIDAFRMNEACITLGVIPYVCANDIHDPSGQELIPLTSMKGNILKSGLNEGVIDVALHGYSHQTISTGQWTEFSGLDYDNQVERLTKGKQLLESLIDAPVTTFVPPWNRFDLNTLRALEELGFSTLSAGKKIRGVTEECKLNILPYTCNLSGLRDAIEASQTSSDTQPVIVVLFHEYDFQEIDGKRGRITYQKFYELMKWLKSQRDVRLLSISQATQVINDLMSAK